MDQALKEIATLGLPIHITELDVNSAAGGQRGFGADIANNAATTQGGLVSDTDKKLTDAYAGIFRAFLNHRDSVKMVTFWGANDANSWRANAAALLRPRALPFVNQKMFQRHEQERAQPALFPARLFEVASLQQPREEGLRQVLPPRRRNSLRAAQTHTADTSKWRKVFPARRTLRWTALAPQSGPRSNESCGTVPELAN